MRFYNGPAVGICHEVLQAHLQPFAFAECNAEFESRTCKQSIRSIADAAFMAQMNALPLPCSSLAGATRPSFTASTRLRRTCRRVITHRSIHVWAKAASGHADGAVAPSMLSPSLLWRQTVATFAAGAVLGPLLDGQHSSHGVLHYAHPTWQLDLSMGRLHWSLETCW